MPRTGRCDLNPIQLLMDEHRLIEKVIDALEVLGRSVQRGEEVSQQDLAGFVRFIREYADACHHGKEEDILFESMAQHGFPKDAGPLGVMYHEHTVGRNFAGILREGAEATAPWPPVLREQVTGAISGYAELLRGHIQKEDKILYPMAEGNLPADAMEKVAGECRAVEEAQRSDGSKAELEKLAEDLIGRYAA